MDQLAGTFWWTGLYREIREKTDNCPSCSASGETLKTQLPQTEISRRNFKRTKPRISSGLRIKSKTRRDVYVLVAVDRFSKWPTAQICKNTDSRTVVKFSTKCCSGNDAPTVIRTNNGSCFKSQEFKNYCNGENIQPVQCTPNLHMRTGRVERTIRTIKSLTRANLPPDGLNFEENMNLANKSSRQTPHSALKMTPFQMHFGRKPRTSNINMIVQPNYLLSNWKKLYNQIRFSPTRGVTSVHHSRLRWKIR